MSDVVQRSAPECCACDLSDKVVSTVAGYVWKCFYQVPKQVSITPPFELFTGQPKPHLLAVEMHLHAARPPSSMCTFVPSRRNAEICRCITWALTISSPFLQISLPMRLAAGMYVNTYLHNMISSLLPTLSHDHA